MTCPNNEKNETFHDIMYIGFVLQMRQSTSDMLSPNKGEEDRHQSSYRNVRLDENT